VLVAVVASGAVRDRAFGPWNSGLGNLGNLDACFAFRQCMGSHRQGHAFREHAT